MALFTLLLYFSFAVEAFTASVCKQSVDIGYDVSRVSGLATSLAKSNWEWGTQAQALLELSDPDVSVFSDTAFPGGKIPNKKTAATDYAKGKIKTTGNTLTAAGGELPSGCELVREKAES